jgi:hypothetical protein
MIAGRLAARSPANATIPLRPRYAHPGSPVPRFYESVTESTTLFAGMTCPRVWLLSGGEIRRLCFICVSCASAGRPSCHPIARRRVRTGHPGARNAPGAAIRCHGVPNAFRPACTSPAPTSCTALRLLRFRWAGPEPRTGDSPFARGCGPSTPATAAWLWPCPSNDPAEANESEPTPRPADPPAGGPSRISTTASRYRTLLRGTLRRSRTHVRKRDRSPRYGSLA